MDTLATTHVMRMDRSDRQCLVLATFVTAPSFTVGTWVSGFTETGQRMLLQSLNGVDKIWVESPHSRDRGSPNTFLATHSNGHIWVRPVMKIKFIPERSEAGTGRHTLSDSTRRAVKRRIDVDIGQDDAPPCIDAGMWDRVWDFGDDEACEAGGEACEAGGEAGDEDAPEMPLGDDSMQLDPVDALAEAQQEAEEAAEQGIDYSNLTPVEIKEIAKAVHQHNQRLVHNERRCMEKKGRVGARKLRRI
jgi:hypothetical protein